MALPIEREDYQEVKRRADIVVLAERLGFKVKKRGTGNYFVPCPFHDDRAADGGSCCLHPVKDGDHNWFHCFGECSANGTVLDFYAQAKGMACEGEEFWRVVEEVNDFMGCGVDLRRRESVPDNFAEETREMMGCFPVADPVTVMLPEPIGKLQIDGWLIPKPAMFWTMPEQMLRRTVWTSVAGNRPDAMQFPIHALAFPRFDVIALVEHGSRRLVGVCYAHEQDQRLDFRYQRGRRVLMQGCEFGGREPDESAPRLFSVQVAVENPIDYYAVLAAVKEEVKCCWGVWSGSVKISNRTRYTIPAVVAVHTQGSSSSERFQKALVMQQPWLPRQVSVSTPSLSLVDPGELKALVEDRVLHGNQPAAAATSLC